MEVLRKLWEGWKRFAHRVGVFNTKVLLFLFYYLALGPVSLVMRLVRPDQLDKRVQDGSLYRSPEGATLDLDRARRQF